MRTCSFEGCGRLHYARTLCHTHYCQMRRGDQLRPIKPRKKPPYAAAERDAEGRKFCRTCYRWAPVMEFVVDRARPDGLSPDCKACRSARLRAWKYGLTPDDLERMIHDQDGSCALCPAPLADGYCIDHDHRCCSDIRTCGGCIRGLLCQECNKLVGKLEGDPERLARMLDYIKG